MLRFRGSPALSAFRLKKLLVTLRERIPQVTGLYAEFIHFVDTAKPCNSHEQEILERLLHYGPRASTQPLNNTSTVLVVPRPGTLSPWSSKATDITHNCGLTQIHRIERGVAYYLTQLVCNRPN